MLSRRHFLTSLALAAMMASSPVFPFTAAADGEPEGLLPGSAASAIYGFNQLAALDGDTTLVFDYRLDGDAIAPPFTDRIVLNFSRQGVGKEDGGATFSVDGTMFARTRKQTIPSISASRVNPILLIFLQHDVAQMNGNTGGSGGYFRNAIRRALGAPGEGKTEVATVTFGGRSIPAKLITLRPFENEANEQRMPSLARKIYRIMVSEEVPGGIYEIQTEVPGENGQAVLLRETYRFKEALQ
ncbi:hypothetical protein [Chelativorans salis]|uniref:Tat pathway signal sequence domain protein n=1 Tax=Chelativorans salis TaxID=2978478 RepID=A0ABT2LKW4_9HYPH|nr:hypothetical protein [Chelativorans sp. EGI FJ00035]MCT7374293.1 hypothetical protein [Chelativorans sp. EGI FJ00035]